MSSAAVVVGALRVKILPLFYYGLVTIFVWYYRELSPCTGGQPWNNYYLTLKAPNKNCSRRHFNFLLLSFEENKA